MRWYEIQENFKAAQPLSLRSNGGIKKATPLIPAASPVDPITAITQQVAAMMQGAAREDMSDEDMKQKDMLEKMSNNLEKKKPSMLDKDQAREEIKRQYGTKK